MEYPYVVVRPSLDDNHCINKNPNVNHHLKQPKLKQYYGTNLIVVVFIYFVEIKFMTHNLFNIKKCTNKNLEQNLGGAPLFNIKNKHT